MAEAKGKKRRAELEHDAELEDKLTKKASESSRGKAEAVSAAQGVSGGSLRGVMTETIARVVEELWPGQETHDGNETPDIEISEIAYVLNLHMIVGTEDYKPRRGLKIRNAEMKPPLCRECK